MIGEVDASIEKDTGGCWIGVLVVRRSVHKGIKLG
jgi:hypothetical protein